MITISKHLPRQSVSSPIQISALRALAYFDLFHYPLTIHEIRQFMDEPVTETELESALNELVGSGAVHCIHHFYSLQSNPLFIYRRIQGNLRAEKLLPKARRIGRLLGKMPFVRGVAISGSLSKYFADEDADIDFFIITASNRLWIARSLMHAIKKLSFLIGKQHWFCMNYYIDEEALLIAEQNVFTATEIKTLMPASGKATFDRFFYENDWTQTYLPSCKDPICRKTDRNFWLKKIMERLINIVGGNRLDDYLYKLTTSRWNKKSVSGKMNEKGYRMDLITGKHFAKSNPGEFQEKVLSRYEQKLGEFHVSGY